MFRYNVECKFVNGDSQLAQQWLAWLVEGHLQDVLDSGALGTEIVEVDAPVPTFEIRYRFANRRSFEAYEKAHATRLREEGLKRFPVESGIEYRRWWGEVVHVLRSS